MRMQIVSRLIEMFVGLSLFTIHLSFFPDGNSYAHARINYEKGLLYCMMIFIVYVYR